MLACICSVSFHLTEGQRIDALYPPKALDDGELRAVAFHAFPDSMSFELNVRSSVRDTSFSFCIPRSGSTAFLHAVAFCRQRHDGTMQRGGDQRSIVVLSTLPLHCILRPMAQYVGPLCLAHGPEALQSAFNQAAAWEPLPWGGSCELPLGNGTIQVDLPDLSTLPMHAVAAAAALSPRGGILDALIDDLDEATGLPLCLLPGPAGQHAAAAGLFTETDAFTPLAGVLPQLWTLWEVLVLGQPLLVASPGPAACSAAVTALISLVAPFPYGADFRPYYTIHDPSFGAFAAKQLPGGDTGVHGSAPLPTVLGITSPHLLSALSHWPNIISSGYTPLTQAATGGGSDDGSVGGDHGAASGVAGSPRRASGVFSGVRLGGLLGRGRSGAQSLVEHPTDAAWLAYRPHTRADQDLLASFVATRPGDGAGRRRRLAQLNTGILRGHFQALTRALLEPLLPFITPTPPRAGDGRQEPPSLPAFDGAAFLKSISSGQGATIPDLVLRRFTSRKALAQFYGMFIESAPFKSWLSVRRGAAEAWQDVAWRQACRAPGGMALPGAPHAAEVADVDAFLSLEAVVKASAALGLAGEQDAVDRLCDAFKRLPGDLQKALLLSPGRAELLGVASGQSPQE